uniref:Uncharacterized protein n=1 Tax=Arion vulgaris TaxID=1028688 RepID=A0A0B6YRM2_9EUPU
MKIKLKKIVKNYKSDKNCLNKLDRNDEKIKTQNGTLVLEHAIIKLICENLQFVTAEHQGKPRTCFVRLLVKEPFAENLDPTEHNFKI